MDMKRWLHGRFSRTISLKFQHKLMGGYLLGCVIPVLIVSMIIYNQSVAGLEDASQEFATLYTSQIEGTLNNLMQEYDKITKSLLVDSDLISKLQQSKKLSMSDLIQLKLTVERALMRVALLKPDIVNIMLVSPDNMIFQYTNTTNTVKEESLLDQEWLKHSRNTDKPFFVTGMHDHSYYDGAGSGAIVTLGRVLYAPNGAYAGMILIDLDPFALLPPNQDFVLVRDKYDMKVMIRNEQGEIVYHSDASSGIRSWQEVQTYEAAFPDEPAANGNDNIIITGMTETGGLTIKTEIPRQKLLLRIHKVRLVTGMVLAASFLIMVFISLGLSYSIIKPIRELRRSMKQVEVGQYMPIAHVQTQDEIGGLVNSYNKMIVTIRTLIEEVYLAEIKQRQAKIVALQNQINPHMLYNTLESIRMKALVNQDDEVAEMIKILAKMFRLALGKQGSDHLIEHELEYTENYVKLQNIRYHDRFRLEIRIPDDMKKCKIIPLVFQPIVENCIKHGFVDHSQQMKITIEGIWTGEREGIRIRISDDGYGISKDKLSEMQRQLREAETDKIRIEQRAELSGRGLGLVNISERIRLHYGEPYRLQIISDTDKGMTVEIYIPNLEH